MFKTLIKSVNSLIILVGSIPQGSKMVLGSRMTQTERIPEEIAPITSNGCIQLQTGKIECVSRTFRKIDINVH
jgi:hypothetical protein